MSNKNIELIGRWATLYLDGGWEMNGRIMEADDNRFILDFHGKFFMVYKDKISAILMNADETPKPSDLPQPRAVSASDEKESEHSLDHLLSGGYDIAERVRAAVIESDREFEKNEIGSANQYGSILPADMLIADPKTDKYDVDLTVSMHQLDKPEKRTYSKDGE
jgi:sRNA-binding regulator protein Hfq